MRTEIISTAAAGRLARSSTLLNSKAKLIAIRSLDSQLAYPRTQSTGQARLYHQF